MRLHSNEPQKNRVRSHYPVLFELRTGNDSLEVSVADLLGSRPHTQRAKPGPVSQLERRLEQVKLLPRKKQQLIIEFLDAIISEEKA